MQERYFTVSSQLSSQRKRIDGKLLRGLPYRIKAPEKNLTADGLNSDYKTDRRPRNDAIFRQTDYAPSDSDCFAVRMTVEFVDQK
jgi:hypothetical protein